MALSKEIVNQDLLQQTLYSDIILENIFKYLSYEELLQTRMVCKKWKPECDRTLKKRDSFIFLSTEKDIMKMTTKIDELKKKNDHIIFNKFAMVFEGISLALPVVQGFFDKHGSCITQLKIRFARTELEDYEEEEYVNMPGLLKKLLEEQLPNVESLQFFGFPDIMWLSDNLFDVSRYKDKTKLLPKLKSLGWFIVEGYVHPADCPLYLNILRCIPYVRKFSVNCSSCMRIVFDKAHSSISNPLQAFFFNVKEFSTVYGNLKSTLTQNRPEACEPTNNADCIDSLVKLCPNLSKLRLCLGTSVSKCAFERLMKTLADQLEELELSDHFKRYIKFRNNVPDTPPSNQRDVELSAIVFKKLKILRVKDVFFLPVKTIGQLLPKNFPALRFLKIIYSEDMFSRTVWQDSSYHPLTSLVIDGLPVRGNGYVSLKNFSDSFPFLKRLKVNVPNDRVLRDIYKLFSNLEELEIVGGFSDEGISGIPQAICDLYYKTIGVDSVQDPSFCNTHRSGPYIGDMKRLRKLKMISNLSSISTLYGIADLKNLTSLYMEFSWINDMPFRGAFFMPMLKLLNNLIKLEVSQVYLQSADNVGAIKKSVCLRLIPDRNRYLV